MIILMVAVNLVLIGALGTVHKGLERKLEKLEIGGWFYTIQSSEILKSVRILRRVLGTWEGLLSLRLQWKSISLHWYGKHTKSIINDPFGLVFLFNGISTFVGYLMPKLFS